ncbi:MAG: AtpZ/AtpI family protein [Bryobacterales bacterium]|nr:AtpZ/AtpI family protein [Bryobacterales bacterium]
MARNSQPESPSGSGSGKRDEQRAWRQAAEYSGLAMSMPIAAVLGYLAGNYLDGLWGTRFLGVVGLVFGIASGFAQLVSKALRDAKSSER